MNRIVRLTIALMFLCFTLPAAAVDFDTSEYDSDVCNFIFEVHERLLQRDIKKEEFDQYYQQLVQSPKGDTLSQVTIDMFVKAQREGVVLTNQNFVLFTHRVILGSYSLTRNYTKMQVDEDLNSLLAGKASQIKILNKRLRSPQGQDRMLEVMSGDIKKARFNAYKLSAN